MKHYTDYSLLRHNTFGMDVRASHFIEYSSEEELQQLIPQLSSLQPLLHIGGGSNLLFRADFEGTVLHSAIRGITAVGGDTDTVLLRAGAAEVWDDFVAYTVREGLGGAENLSLIPGEVGASAVQNIGAYGAEAKDIIDSVEAISLRTGEKRTFGNADCRYAYRQSIFKQELKGQYAITHVTYRLSRRPRLNTSYGGIRDQLVKMLGADRLGQATVATVRQAIIDIRREKLPDPATLGNAGSFFMNPVVPRSQFLALQQQYPDVPHYELDDGRVKVPAGWLIDQCGWKGRNLGSAAVHSRQALVLVNLGGATPADILRLSDAVCQSVKQKFGIDIRPEVNFI
ncbi:MAG: UDP-N-acetylmuramate dehydrogenase [Bacteroidaceae bacterium]|nr:UDP-N-acetylmuramate dehydrogenase [Bacteroidaceae bacterium]